MIIQQFLFVLPDFMKNMERPIFIGLPRSLEDRELRKIVLEAAMTERDSEHAEEEIDDCINHLEKYRIN